MKFRLATEHDLADVARCVATFGETSPTKEPDAPRKIVIVGEDNGSVVGTCSIIIEQKIFHHYGKVAHVEDVAVLPEHRGKGFGKELVEAAKLTARAMGCYKVILSCSEANVGFYENCGFRRHEVSMRLDLAPTHV